MIKIISSILDFIVEFITIIIESVSDVLQSLMNGEKKTSYDASFMDSGDILSRWNKGFCVTGKLSLPVESSFSNCLVLGSTSSGKSSRVLIPSILKMRGGSSLCINDPSGELYEKTSGALADAGYIVKTLNYSQPALSLGYNPLHRAKTISDIQKISKIIVVNTLGHSKDPFWNMSAESLITIVCRYLKFYAAPEFQTLHCALYLINTLSYAPDKIDKLFVNTDSLLLAEYKSFISYGDKTLASIIATCKAALGVFSDPTVAAVTSSDSLNLDEFRTQKVALFINNSIKDMRYYSVITSIFFEQFWGEIMSRIPDKKELPIFFLLDESSSMFLTSLNITISNIRKFRSGLMQVYQSYNQISDLYGSAQAKNIAANCFCKVYMSGQPIEIAQELETVLGKFEYKDEKEIRHIRPLMTSDEIRLLSESIILCGNHKAIKAKMVPYFEQYKLRKLSEIEPCIPQGTITNFTPPLIDLD